MPHPSKTKGDRAEREIAATLTELLGRPIVRKLGAGRKEDTGDLVGLDDVTLEVKNVAQLGAAITEGLADSTREQAHAGTTLAAALIRRRGGDWFVALTLDQFAQWVAVSESCPSCGLEAGA